MIWFICANVQLSHYQYGPLLGLPVLSIFVSILFVDKRLTHAVSIASCVTTLMSSCIAAFELREGDAQLLADTGLSLIVIFAALICATLLINYVKEQIDYIASGTQREQILLEKLQLDALMGIYNRKKMENVIRSLLEHETVADNGLCLLMLDLDHFKAVNDTYGHLCGDQVLMTLADVIRQFGTKNIIPCRYGGEEIVIILKDTDLRGAFDFANALLDKFRTRHYAFAPELTVSFSCGISVFTADMTRDQWIQAADEALYRAKEQGRNRVLPDPSELEATSPQR